MAPYTPGTNIEVSKVTYICIQIIVLECHNAGRSFQRLPLLISSTGLTAFSVVHNQNQLGTVRAQSSRVLFNYYHYSHTVKSATLISSSACKITTWPQFTHDHLSSSSPATSSRMMLSQQLLQVHQLANTHQN